MVDEADRAEHTVSTRVMELVVAGVFMALSILIMWDNWRIGARWEADGPGAGYFPFRIGVIMLVVSLATFVINLRPGGAARQNFVERSQLRLVMQVLVPTVVFAALIPFLGIYLAAALFIAFFMRWLGRYPFHTIIPVSLGVPAFLFLMFEIWFLVPLPKGPVETAFGY